VLTGAMPCAQCEQVGRLPVVVSGRLGETFALGADMDCLPSETKGK